MLLHAQIIKETFWNYNDFVHNLVGANPKNAHSKTLSKQKLSFHLLGEKTLHQVNRIMELWTLLYHGHVDLALDYKFQC